MPRSIKPLHAEYAELRKRYPLRIGADLAENAENGLSFLRAIAQLRGGQLLSNDYRGNTGRYRVRCGQGHEWETPGNSLVRGTWCPHCAQSQNASRQYPSDGLQRIQRAAHTRGGQCLDGTYHGLLSHYTFRCAHGHEWSTAAQTVISGSWCPHCDALEKAEKYLLADGLERLQRKAHAKGGVCLDAKYTGTQTKYRFRCARGHEWQATGNRVLLGSWCPICRNENRRLGIEAMQELAVARGGQCLSESYLTSTTKLEWLCNRGHSWWATPSSVKRGSWCPSCAHMNNITNRKSKARSHYIAAGATPDLSGKD